MRFVGGDTQCAAAAFFFVLSNILELVFDIAYRKAVWSDRYELENLDVGAIEDFFFAQSLNSGIEFASEICSCIGWVLLAIILVRLAWTMSEGGKVHMGAGITLVVLALSGAFTKIIGTLLYMGVMKTLNSIPKTYNMDVWLKPEIYQTFDAMKSLNEEPSYDDTEDLIDPEDLDLVAPYNEEADAPQGVTDPESFTPEVTATAIVETPDGPAVVPTPPHDRLLQQFDGDNIENGYPFDGIGWKSLELLRLSMQGLMFWIQSIEFLFLATIMVMTFFSVRRSKGLSQTWAKFGLALAVLLVFEFIAESLAFQNSYSWAYVAILFGGLNRIFLMPAWVVWLGFLLPKDESEIEECDEIVDMDHSTNSKTPLEMDDVLS